MTPHNEFDREERKTPSKRNWQRRPERGDDQPRAPKRPKPKRPDEVVWDWEDADDELDDNILTDDDGGFENEDDDVNESDDDDDR